MKQLLILCLLCLMFFDFANVAKAKQIRSEDLPDYLGTIAIPLTKKDARALRMTGNYARHGIEPFMTSNGKLVYIHGASLVTILASPLQVVDIEMQRGEQINEVIIGDTARWKIEKGQVADVSHIFIKPIDSNIETNAVITTNRRVYHFRLISTQNKITPYIGFLYAEEMLAYSADQKTRQAKEEHKKSLVGIEGELLDLSKLNFHYRIKGRAKWTPERVYDTGITTYIEFPPEVRSGMPILLAESTSSEELVNYRVKSNFMIVDGVFDRLFLVIGVGNDEEIVMIAREN